MSVLWAVIIAFVVTLLTGLLLRPLAIRVGLTDTPGGRKQHSGEIPLVGGVAIFMGVICGLLVKFTSISHTVPFILSCGILVLTGLFDDIYEIHVILKFLVQILAALIMIFWGNIYLHQLGYLFFTKAIILKHTKALFTLFGVLSVINAVNMIDGLDGLAGGITLIMLLLIAVLAFMSNMLIPQPHLLLLIAALLAFLCLNYPFSKKHGALIFMGDAGSMLLGFSVAWFCIQFSQGTKVVAAPVMFLWIVALPLLDTAYVMFRRVAHGVSPFKPDRHHLHHLLLNYGFSKRHTVWIMYALTLFFGLIGIFAYKLHLNDGYLFMAAIATFFLYCFAVHAAWSCWRKYKGSP